MTPDTITADEAHALLYGKQPRRNKYNAKPTVSIDGNREDSKSQAARVSDLNLLQRAGRVITYARQPKFQFVIPEWTYRADFIVVECDEAGRVRIVVEDVKGVETQEFKKNVALWRQYGPYTLRILKRKRGGWDVREIPGGRENGGVA